MKEGTMRKTIATIENANDLTQKENKACIDCWIIGNGLNNSDGLPSLSRRACVQLDTATNAHVIFQFGRVRQRRALRSLGYLRR